MPPALQKRPPLSPARRRQRLRRRRRRQIARLLLVCAVALALLAGRVFAIRAVFFRPASTPAPTPAPTEYDEPPLAAGTPPDYVTQDILPQTPYSRPGRKLEAINAVVVHYTGNPGTTAKQNRSYFGNLATTHETYASSHFVIGLEGEIIQCVPLDEVAFCSNDRNDDTISIEVCHEDESGAFNEQTYEALVKLTAWLCDTFSLDSETGVIRHYDVTGKECPRYFVQNEDAWQSFLYEVGESVAVSGTN